MICQKTLPLSLVPVSFAVHPVTGHAETDEDWCQPNAAASLGGKQGAQQPKPRHPKQPPNYPQFLEQPGFSLSKALVQYLNSLLLDSGISERKIVLFLKQLPGG